MNDDKEKEIAVVDIAPDAVLALVQTERLKLYQEEGANTDIKMKLLDGLASTALGIKRLVADDNAAIANREIAAALVTTLRDVKENPFRLVSYNGGNFVPPEIPSVTPLHDETSTELPSISYEDIIKD